MWKGMRHDEYSWKTTVSEKIFLGVKSKNKVVLTYYHHGIQLSNINTVIKIIPSYSWLSSTFLLNPTFRNKPFVYIISQIITMSYMSMEKLAWWAPIHSGDVCCWCGDVSSFPLLGININRVNSVAPKYFWGHALLSLDVEKLTTMLYALKPNQCWFTNSSFWRYVEGKHEFLPL